MSSHKPNKVKSGFQFNWGTGIVISFILFCSFILYIVVQAFQQDIDLVSETYYLDELTYQDRMEEQANLLASGEAITVEQTSDELVIQFPELFAEATGDIHFYHPSRELFDKHFSIALTENYQQHIAKDELVKGNYYVKVTWEVAGTSYFQQESIYLR